MSVTEKLNNNQNNNKKNKNKNEEDNEEEEDNNNEINSPVKYQTLTPNKNNKSNNSNNNNNYNNNSTSSCSKTWCSPFTNFLNLTPEAPSRYTMADLSPHSIFSSPWIQQSSEVLSPLSLNKTSFFSPSLFSPFNKSLNPLKLDKFSIDYDDSSYNDSKYSPRNIEDSENGLNLPYQHYDNNLDGGTPRLTFGNDDIIKSNQNSTTRGTKRKNDDLANSSISNSLLEAIELHSPLAKQNLDDHKYLDIKRNKLPQILPKSQISSSSSSAASSSLIPSSLTTLASVSVSTAPVSTTRLKSNSIDFTSPALISQAQETNMSPDMSQRNRCNCKKSRCLKLYCECFAALRYCSSCHCTDCNNIAEFESVRQEAIQMIRERNSSAFQLKVNVNRGHMAGCHCKKSRCLKKYCECFEGSVYCGPNCKCVECQNVVDSEALKQVKIYGSIKEKKDRASQQKTDLSDSSDCDTSHNNNHHHNNHSRNNIINGGNNITRIIRQPLFNQSYQPINNNNNNQQQQQQQNNNNKNTNIGMLGTLIMNPKNIVPSINTVYSDICLTKNLLNDSKIEKIQENNNSNNNNNVNETQIKLQFNDQQFKQEPFQISQIEEKDKNDQSNNNHNNNHIVIKKEEEKLITPLSLEQELQEQEEQEKEQEKKEPLYPFFGENIPPTSKLIALSCLQYFDGPSLYSISCVNKLWNQAVMDDALWE